jgi:hypothetical protein
MWFPCQIAPAAHQAGAVHVNERVRHMQILGGQLIEELLMRETEPSLVQVVDVGVA